MISASLPLTFVERALNTLRRPDLRPAWKEAKLPLRGDIRDHRDAQSGPGGSWAPRASSTTARRAASKRNRPKRMLGKLPTALSTLSDRRRVAMKSRVAWSDIHQKGGIAGHGAKIPARPFLWVSQTALNAIGYIVSRHLAKIFGRA